MPTNSSNETIIVTKYAPAMSAMSSQDRALCSVLMALNENVITLIRMLKPDKVTIEEKSYS